MLEETTERQLEEVEEQIQAWSRVSAKGQRQFKKKCQGREITVTTYPSGTLESVGTFVVKKSRSITFKRRYDDLNFPYRTPPFLPYYILTQSTLKIHNVQETRVILYFLACIAKTLNDSSDCYCNAYCFYGLFFIKDVKKSLKSKCLTQTKEQVIIDVKF